MQLPLINIEDQASMLMQTKWKSILDPLLANKLTQGNLLSNVALGSTSVAVNHLLGRMPQGWMLVDLQGNATVWRSQPFTTNTLTLTASVAVTCNIWVF